MAYDDERDIHFFFSLESTDLLINRVKDELLKQPCFQQFNFAPASCFLVQYNGKNKFDPDKFSLYLKLEPFDGINYRDLNTYSFGPYESDNFPVITGATSSGGPEGISIAFSVTQKEQKHELKNKTTMEI